MLKAMSFLFLGQVMEQARASNCPAYACEFVALAKDLEVQLVTLDAQIVSGYPGIAQHLSAFLES